jgi:hypothetical protein
VCETLDLDVCSVTLCSIKNAVRSYPIGINQEYAKIYSRKTSPKSLYHFQMCLFTRRPAPQMRAEWILKSKRIKLWTVNCTKNILREEQCEVKLVLKWSHFLLGLLPTASRADVQWNEVERSVISCKEQDDTISLCSLVSRCRNKTQTSSVL